MTNFWPFLCSFQNVLIIRQSRMSSQFKKTMILLSTKIKSRAGFAITSSGAQWSNKNEKKNPPERISVSDNNQRPFINETNRRQSTLSNKY